MFSWCKAKPSARETRKLVLLCCGINRHSFLLFTHTHQSFLVCIFTVKSRCTVYVKYAAHNYPLVPFLSCSVSLFNGHSLRMHEMKEEKQNHYNSQIARQTPSKAFALPFHCCIFTPFLSPAGYAPL